MAQLPSDCSNAKLRQCRSRFWASSAEAVGKLLSRDPPTGKVSDAGISPNVDGASQAQVAASSQHDALKLHVQLGVFVVKVLAALVARCNEIAVFAKRIAAVLFIALLVVVFFLVLHPLRSNQLLRRKTTGKTETKTFTLFPIRMVWSARSEIFRRRNAIRHREQSFTIFRVRNTAQRCLFFSSSALSRTR